MQHINSETISFSGAKIRRQPTAGDERERTDEGGCERVRMSGKQREVERRVWWDGREIAKTASSLRNRIITWMRGRNGSRRGTGGEKNKTKNNNVVSIIAALSLLARGATGSVLQLMRQKTRKENVGVGGGNEVLRRLTSKQIWHQTPL